MSKKCESCDARNPVNYYQENFYCNDCIDDAVYYTEVCGCDENIVCTSCEMKDWE